MNPNYLDFEQPIADLEAKIQDLRSASAGPAVNVEAEVNALQDKLRVRTAQIFRNLTSWQVLQLARHPSRPYTADYIRIFCDEFQELAGDRAFADDKAIMGGLARIGGRSVMLIGHQKGRDTKEKIKRNFGMPKPEGYRKALRLMKMAERFGLPVLTLIDTAGAWPGIDAESRGQSEAIARNLMEMAELKVPVICTVIGEGGSGGALALGVGDRTVMLEYSVYSTITPEGCASILWKDAGKAKEAAEQLGMTAPRLKSLGLIDKMVREPPAAPTATEPDGQAPEGRAAQRTGRPAEAVGGPAAGPALRAPAQLRHLRDHLSGLPLRWNEKSRTRKRPAFFMPLTRPELS